MVGFHFVPTHPTFTLFFDDAGWKMVGFHFVPTHPTFTLFFDDAGWKMVGFHFVPTHPTFTLDEIISEIKQKRAVPG
jgi:hypothetical protein